MPPKRRLWLATMAAYAHSFPHLPTSADCLESHIRRANNKRLHAPIVTRKSKQPHLDGMSTHNTMPFSKLPNAEGSCKSQPMHQWSAMCTPHGAGLHLSAQCQTAWDVSSHEMQCKCTSAAGTHMTPQSSFQKGICPNVRTAGSE